MGDRFQVPARGLGAGGVEDLDRLADQVLDNLRRYVGAGCEAGGEELSTALRNVVDKRRGYVASGR